MNSFYRGAVTLVLFVAASVGAVSSARADVTVSGAGATFPEPLYSKWAAEYHEAHPDVKLNYNGIGSGGGIKGITDKTLDFAGSDAPMNKKEIEAVGGPGAVIEFPSCAGAVVPAYNLPGVNVELKFTGAVLADIYLRKITKWTDPAIAALNPGVSLPDQVILPVSRSDGSGTTFVFTSYLSTQSPDFMNKVGVGKLVTFPGGGAAGKGTAGVAALVKDTVGAIGYIELQYGVDNQIPFGAVQNAAGEFIKATPESVSKAGEGAVDHLTGAQLTANIWNQKLQGAYPIATFTYLIAYKDLRNLKTPEQAQSLVNFLFWATHEGQATAAKSSYAPLSAGVQKKVEAVLAAFTYQGKPVIPAAK